MRVARAAIATMSLLAFACPKERAVANLGVDRKVIRVLVVGDGFTKDFEGEFNTALASAKNGFKLLERRTDVTFDVQSKFIATSVLGTSKLGIMHNGKPEKCYFTFDNAISNIHAVSPGFEYYFVIFAENGTGGGCAKGRTMVVEFLASENTIAHEMGHSAIGLYDERSGDAGTPPPIDPTNCSVSKASPPWQAQIDSGALREPESGCRHYDLLWRPSDQCRMRTTAEPKLCARCELLVMETMARRATAQALAPPVFPLDVESGPLNSIEVEAVITGDGKLIVLDAFEVDARKIAAPVITGETFVVIDAKPNGTSDSRTIIGIAPLAMDDGRRMTLAHYPDMIERRLDLRARSYEPGMGEDLLVPVNALMIRFTLAGVTPAEVKQRALRLTLRKLEAPGRGQLITVETRTRLSLASFEGAPVDVSTPLDAFLSAR